MGKNKVELDREVSPSTLELHPDPELIVKSGNQGTKGSIRKRIDLPDSPLPEWVPAKIASFHTMYTAQAGQRMDALESTFHALGKPDSIVVMLYCGSYFPLLENWLASCDTHGINVRDRLIGFALDEVASELSARCGVKHVYLDPRNYSNSGGSSMFADVPFLDTMLYKNAVILDALSLGANILFQDVDVVWFRDPFPCLERKVEEADIRVMFNGCTSISRPFHANTGFMHISSNQSTRAVFETALRNSTSIYRLRGQQPPLNRIFKHFVDHNLLTLSVLPENRFLNGHLFNLEDGISDKAGNWKRDGIVFHYSWTGNRQEKLLKLKMADSLYVDIAD